MIRRLCIIGVGLIGGSLARALRRAQVVDSIIGYSRNADNLQKAQALGVIDEYSTELAHAVRDADMIVLCVPLGAMQRIMAEVAEVMSAEAILTDVGSAKSSVVEAARMAMGDRLRNFVPGHPIAGTERSGVEASFAELFAARRVILTPLEENPPEYIERVREMWLATGAAVQEMSVRHHDDVLAATSHLPHILAYALVDTLARLSDRDEIFQYAAGGFRDFTRIASSDPVMWRDICLSNREAILGMLDRFVDDLASLREAIDTRDANALHDLFTSAKRARDRYTSQNE